MKSFESVKGVGVEVSSPMASNDLCNNIEITFQTSAMWLVKVDELSRL